MPKHFCGPHVVPPQGRAKMRKDLTRYAALSKSGRRLRSRQYRARQLCTRAPFQFCQQRPEISTQVSKVKSKTLWTVPQTWVMWCFTTPGLWSKEADPSSRVCVGPLLPLCCAEECALGKSQLCHTKVHSRLSKQIRVSRWARRKVCWSC